MIGCNKKLDTPDGCSSCGDISFDNKILLCNECKSTPKMNEETSMNKQEKELYNRGFKDGRNRDKLNTKKLGMNDLSMISMKDYLDIIKMVVSL